MTTISPFAAGAYATNRNTSQLLTLKGQLNDLSTQLSTGLKAQTYGGLGVQRSTALSAQATLSALDGYSAGIAAAQTRTKLAVTGLTQVATLGKGARTALDNGLQSVPVNSTASRSVALANLRSALDALNQTAAGDYVLGGRNSSTQPVAETDLILDGTTNADGTTKAGLAGVIAEQVDADLGPGKNGRLTASKPEVVPITLTEDDNDATRGKFGFTLSGKPTATGTAIKPDYTPGTGADPGSLTLTVTAQPAVGDKVAFPLKLPDGTTTTVTLTATAGAGSASAFQVGANADETSRNLSTALTRAIEAAAGGALTASSTARAAQNFFTGSAGAGVNPKRVDYDAKGNPTGYRAGTAQDTVVWYQGEDSGTDPRATQSVQVGASSSVETGARANEAAIRTTLAGLATVAYGLPETASADIGTVFPAVADRARTLLSAADTSPSVQDIVTALSLASSQLSDAQSTNKATQNTLRDTLDGIEQAPTQEVAVKLMDLQNRLQASYQLTSSLSKLSLVNYLG